MKKLKPKEPKEGAKKTAMKDLLKEAVKQKRLCIMADIFRPKFLDNPFDSP